MPAWLPGDTQIAFTTDVGGRKTYRAIDLDTRRERSLFEPKEPVDYVRLSQDGKRIAYNLTLSGVINTWSATIPDGTPKQLTFDNEMMAFPAWAPDGNRIAMQIRRGDDTNLAVMPAEGGTPTVLTSDKGQSWIFDWSPDGDKILFAGQRDGFWNVWWYSLSTHKELSLTDYKKLNSFVRYPSWSPKGDQIAYEYSETTGNIWVSDIKGN
jgi:TolB protein